MTRTQFDAKPLDVIYDQAVKIEALRLASAAGRELAMVALGDADHRILGRLENAQTAVNNAIALLMGTEPAAPAEAAS